MKMTSNKNKNEDDFKKMKITKKNRKWRRPQKNLNKEVNEDDLEKNGEKKWRIPQKYEDNLKKNEDDPKEKMKTTSKTKEDIKTTPKQNEK